MKTWFSKSWVLGLAALVGGLTMNSTFAADCMKGPKVSGTYVNSAGDKYHLEQLCNKLVFSDLQLHKNFVVMLDGSKNELKDTTLRMGDSGMAGIKSNIYYKADSKEWESNTMKLTFTGILRLDPTERETGIANPLLRMDMELNYVPAENNIDNSAMIYVTMKNIRADVGSNPSKLQGSLVKGMNVAFRLVDKILPATGFGTLDSLKRVSN